MKQNVIETVLGLVVLIATLVLLIFVYQNQDKRNKYATGYIINTECTNAEGIVIGSDIKIAGVKVGSIKKIAINPKNFSAIIVMSIDKKIQLPDDSLGNIATSSLLGNKYISITPGISNAPLKPGDTIKIMPAINLESLIGKFLYHK